MVNYLPLITTIVSSIFAVLLIRQFLWRRKIHQFNWSIGILLYGAAAFMEFLMNPDLVGATPSSFQIYYVLSAPLVGFLGAGVVYLLFNRKLIGHIFLLFILAMSVGLVITSFLFPINGDALASAFGGELASGFHKASKAYSMGVRIFSILINSIAGTVLIAGATYSFIRDRRRTYNILIAAGGILPMIGGSALALDYPDLFFAFELGGIICLFVGFYLSDRILRERAKKKEELKKQATQKTGEVARDSGSGEA